MTTMVSPAAPAPTAPEPPVAAPVPDGEAWVLNALLGATEDAEGRRPLRRNEFGQWCHRDVYGSWTPHRSFHAAYQAAHAEDAA